MGLVNYRETEMTTRKSLPILLVLVIFYSYSASAQDSGMRFFLTSKGPGNGANLGGLEGADAHCRMLAETSGAKKEQWHAYLSTQATDQQTSINARDRIGEGPWLNAKGVEVASSVANLHSDNNNLTKHTVLNENGEIVSGRGDEPNRHDILTGSQEDGTAFSSGEDRTCSNWTDNGEGSAQIGHHDRVGGGDAGSSWNSSHGTRGCSQENLRGTGGDGLFYCFATD